MVARCCQPGKVGAYGPAAINERFWANEGARPPDALAHLLPEKR